MYSSWHLKVIKFLISSSFFIIIFCIAISFLLKESNHTLGLNLSILDDIKRIAGSNLNIKNSYDNNIANIFNSLFNANNLFKLLE